MFKRKTDEQLFFSTKTELKIGNVVYRPSICYKVPSLAKGSLEKHAAKGLVTFYTEPVRFVNGALAQASSSQAAVSVSSIVRAPEETKLTKKKGS